MAILAVAVGGALGALARYGVTSWSPGSPSILGTLTVNVLGAFTLGLVVGLTELRWSPDPAVRTGLTVGVLGGFTTFSTLMYEFVHQMEAEDYAQASANLVASVLLGLLAVILGLAVGRSFD